jgi:hypothetical protein
MSAFTLLQTFFTLVAGLLLLIGLLLIVGLVQFNKRVPKTHPINRRAGAGVMLLGIGMLSLFALNAFDSIATLSLTGWGLIILGLIAVHLGRRTLQKALKEANRYDG